jgi:hypothetical protein
MLPRHEGTTKKCRGIAQVHYIIHLQQMWKDALPFKIVLLWRGLLSLQPHVRSLQSSRCPSSVGSSGRLLERSPRRESGPSLGGRLNAISLSAEAEFVRAT